MIQILLHDISNISTAFRNIPKKTHKNPKKQCRKVRNTRTEIQNTKTKIYSSRKGRLLIYHQTIPWRWQGNGHQVLKGGRGGVKKRRRYWQWSDMWEMISRLGLRDHLQQYKQKRQVCWEQQLGQNSIECVFMQRWMQYRLSGLNSWVSETVRSCLKLLSCLGSASTPSWLSLLASWMVNSLVCARISMPKRMIRIALFIAELNKKDILPVHQSIFIFCSEYLYSSFLLITKPHRIVFLQRNEKLNFEYSFKFKICFDYFRLFPHTYSCKKLQHSNLLQMDLIIKMNIKGRLIWVLSFITLGSCGYFESPLGKYVGDGNASRIFREESKSNNIIGILFTNRYCDECRMQDQQFYQLIEKVYKLTDVVLYRCELGLNAGLQEQFNIKRFPMIHFVLPKINLYQLYQTNLIVGDQISVVALIKKLKFYFYADRNTEGQIILVNIDELIFADEEDLIQQFGLNHIYQELPPLIFKKDQPFEKYLKEKEVAETDIAKCGVYLSSINKCFFPQSMAEVQYLFFFIILESVHEFTQSFFKHYQSLDVQRYIFVAVLDSLFKRHESVQHIEMLNKLIKEKYLKPYKERIVIYWMETQINKQKLEHLGFSKTDNPPLFAYFDLSSRQKQIFKPQKGKPFDGKMISNFIKGIIQVDQDYQLEQWNYQALESALTKVALNRKIDMVKKEEEIEEEEGVSFVLSLAQVDYDKLDDKDLFSEDILSFNYFVKRIERFSSTDMQKMITLEKIQCQGQQTHGLLMFDNHQCTKLSSDTITKVEKLSPQIAQFLVEKFDLPDKYWVHEDNYAQAIKDQANEKEEWKYVSIDI